MKIRTVQFAPKLGNLEENLNFHLASVRKAVNDKIELIIFPELSTSGYQLKDIVFDLGLSPDHALFRELMQLSRNIDIVIGTPYEEYPGIVYNTAMYFSKGEIKHIHRKGQLPNFGMFEEELIFKAGDTYLPFNIGAHKAGFLVCREILFPIYAYLYYLQGVDLIIAISNSPFRGLGKKEFNSLKMWERLGEVYSTQYHFHYLFVNRTGFEDGIGFGGGSFYSKPGVGITDEAGYYDDNTMDVTISSSDTRKSRIAGNYFRDEKPETVKKELHRILNGNL